MRLGAVFLIGTALAASASAQRDKDDDSNAVERTCGIGECFLERDVRDFEVIDQTHLIVYTGSQRCAFHVEVRGTFCDLTFAPELYFSRINEVPDGRIPRGADPASDRALRDPFDPFELSRRERRDLKICSNDLGIQVHGGRFTESISSNQTDRFGNPRTDCRVSSVEAITDDELVEFWVSRGVVPPLPPMGAGEIEVGDQDDK
jgi:hypothetical protein